MSTKGISISGSNISSKFLGSRENSAFVIDCLEAGGWIIVKGFLRFGGARADARAAARGARGTVRRPIELGVDEARQLISLWRGVCGATSCHLATR